jgi:hypothetical protein
MSSATSSTAPPSTGVWQTVAPYATPPAAAGLAIIPAFKFFIEKSAAQLDKPERVSFRTGIKEGFKTAPTISGIVGSQMLLQAGAEWSLKKCFGKEDEEQNRTPIVHILVSALFVGSVSAPGLVIFNGRTMKQTARQALATLNPKLVAAITARETAFLFFSRMTKPISDKTKEVLGNNRMVQYTTTFFTGAISSLAIHPADTAVTRWQKDKSMPWDRTQPAKCYRQWMQGGVARAKGIGTFYVGFEIASELFKA